MQTQEQILEIAKDYDVTTIRISEKLPFACNHFKHFWVYRKGRWSIMLTKNFKKIKSKCTLPAPQKHELVRLLPTELDINGCKYNLHIGISRISYMGSGVINDPNAFFEPFKYENIGNSKKSFQYADACAKIYLKLKELNIL